MNKKEMQLLIEKALDSKSEFSFSEVDSLYIEAVNNGNFHDAIFYTILAYLHERMEEDAPQAKDALELIKTTIELFLEKNKKVPTNNQKKCLPKGPYCSFCGKSKDEVQGLIAGPSAFICNECIDVSGELLKKKKMTQTN